jgi:hypothetical protein
MGNTEKYRANAHHCQRIADEALTPEDKLNWLNFDACTVRKILL